MSQNSCPFECKLVHIGINAKGTQDANAIAKLFCTAFGLEYRPGEVSDFAGDIVEVMHENGRGENGHIGLGVYSMDEAQAWLESLGYHFLMETAKYDEEGKLKFAYIDGSFGGFAVHIARIPREA